MCVSISFAFSEQKYTELKCYLLPVYSIRHQYGHLQGKRKKMSKNMEPKIFFKKKVLYIKGKKMMPEENFFLWRWGNF